MKSRFASLRVFSGVLLLCVTAAASAGTSTPKQRIAPVSTLNAVATDAQHKPTLADLTTDAQFHAKRFKPLTEVSYGGDWYCRKMLYWCDHGNQSACDKFEQFCTN